VNRIQRCPAISTRADGARGSRLDTIENIFGHGLQFAPRLLNALPFAAGAAIPSNRARLCLHVLNQLLSKVHAGLKLFFRRESRIRDMT